MPSCRPSPASPGIARHGLLSTCAILDRLNIIGGERYAIECQPRPASLALDGADERFVLRDQKPLPAERLARCLDSSMSVADWCALLNRKVFFWLERTRAERLLAARSYRDRAHLVLEIDTAALVDAYAPQVTLAALNTGSVVPFGRPRGRATIAALADYPYAERRNRRLTVAVELCIDYAVPDIQRFVVNRWLARADTEWRLFDGGESRADREPPATTSPATARRPG